MAHSLGTRLDRTFRDALEKRHFSGAGIFISRGDSFVFSREWGHDRWDGEPIEADTRFDLASLTKPLVTVPLVMAAAAKGMIGLDDTISRFFPAPPDKRDITIRHLLSHSSGLAPYRQFFYDLVGIPFDKRRDAMISMILDDPLDAMPGETASYSDLGYILLGAMLENIFDSRLDRLAARMLYAPLGLDELHFCPLRSGAPPESPPEILADRGKHLKYAAAEFCPWRKRLLVGEVSDENAWALGGLAGHAGLFGTVRGVSAMVGFLRDIYRGKIESDLLSREIVRLFWTRTGHPRGSTWALGFDTPRIVGSSAGRYFSQKSVGHLGFTGTSFWLDLDRDILVVLLTNRVHPSRENDALKKFRPVVHNRIMEVFNEI
ncbi:MAG: serine hydrolase domain-containing protein [Syntrophobacter sp.]